MIADNRIVNAWHEAGHTAVGLRLGRYLEFVTIRPTSSQGGMYDGKVAEALTQWTAPPGASGAQMSMRLVDIVAIHLAGIFVEEAKFPHSKHNWTGDER